VSGRGFLGENMENVTMNGVGEYVSGYPVELRQSDGTNDINGRDIGVGRWVVVAFNEGGCNLTEVDVLQLVAWLKEHRPDLIDAKPQ
jgi:hypothetical protein